MARERERLVLGIARFALHLPLSRSLKDKRRVLRAVKDRFRARYGLRVAEIGAWDERARAVLAVALVGSDARRLGSELERRLDELESWALAPVVERRVVVEHRPDLEGAALPWLPGWEEDAAPLFPGDGEE